MADVSERPSFTGGGEASGTGETPARQFTIALDRQPEGVWLATSNEIPGLFVEGDTADEARDEALQWGRELLADNLGYDFSQRTVFVFVEGGRKTYHPL
jgi:predicted RNase H-like HicB family nuclease